MAEYVCWLPSLSEKNVTDDYLEETIKSMGNKRAIIGFLSFSYSEGKVIVKNKGRDLVEITPIDSCGLYTLSTNKIDNDMLQITVKTVWSVFVESICSNLYNPGFYNDSRYIKEVGDGNIITNIIELFPMISEFTSYRSERYGSRRIPFRAIRKEMADNQVVQINSLLYRRFMTSYGNRVNPGYRKACDVRMASSEEYMLMKVDVHGSIHNLYTSNLMRVLAELSMFVSLAVALFTVVWSRLPCHTPSGIWW